MSYLTESSETLRSSQNEQLDRGLRDIEVITE